MKKRIVNLKKDFSAWLKGSLERLSPRTRKITVLTMLALFAVLSLYTFGKAMYDIGRGSNRLEIEHIKRPPIYRGINSNQSNQKQNERTGSTEQESGSDNCTAGQ